MSLIDVQKLSNGEPPAGGKLYIGSYGSNEPEVNPVVIYTDYLLTSGITPATGIDLDQDGFPLINGVRTNLYAKESYSLQLRDRNNAPVFPQARQEVVAAINFDPSVIYDFYNGITVSGVNYGQVVTSTSIPAVMADKYSQFGNGGSIAIESASGILLSSTANSISYLDDSYVLDDADMVNGDFVQIQKTVFNNLFSSIDAGRTTILKEASGLEVTHYRETSNGTDTAAISTKVKSTGEKEHRNDCDRFSTPNMPVYSDDAAAGVGGLVQSDWYQTATGELRIKL